MTDNQKITATVSLQVLPNCNNVFYVVDKVIDFISKSGLNYVVGPLDTTIEGELDELIKIVQKAQEICIEEGAEQLISVVKIIYNPKGVHTISEKTSKYREDKS